MTKEMLSLTELQTFVHELGLMDNRSNIHFNASVHFEILNHEKELDMEVWIHIRSGADNGVIQLIDSNIEERLYPTRHFAKWQQYKFINRSALRVSGKHPQNGPYIITIIPNKH